MSRKEVHFMTSYKSIYGIHIQEFIGMKRKLGYKYVDNAIHLAKIDILAAQNNETSLGITKEFAERWMEKRPHESLRFQHKRISNLTYFSSYLCSVGIQSYVPKLPPLSRSNYIPYIYSPNEIQALFEACDQLRVDLLLMKSCLICMPVLIRLLYSTGIRISEAIALKNEDVNLDENYLHIKDCKNGKDRMIPMSASQAQVCRDYISYRDKLPIEKRSDYFFVKLNGGTFRKEVVGKWFKKCLIKAGIPYIGQMQGPRIHDLRHTFAVSSLANMAKSGIDLYVSLPILSNYLGHQSLDATNQYVRLTANIYPDLIKDVDMICLDVFPKYRHYEAD